MHAFLPGRPLRTPSEMSLYIHADDLGIAYLGQSHAAVDESSPAGPVHRAIPDFVRINPSSAIGFVHPSTVARTEHEPSREPT